MGFVLWLSGLGQSDLLGGRGLGGFSKEREQDLFFGEIFWQWRLLSRRTEELPLQLGDLPLGLLKLPLKTINETVSAGQILGEFRRVGHVHVMLYDVI
jgi:hypothetical protein